MDTNQDKQQREDKMNIQEIERIGNEAQKRNDSEFKENKKNINFSLRGRNKYFYAYQCALFVKNVKKYDAKGERSIALSWTGYEDLIAGTVKFDEKNYKGTLSLPLPNNDGNCDGTYSLQEDGKGTWQIACSNNMGAAGTLKWSNKGSVIGSGRDYNDNKVKFTISK